MVQFLGNKFGLKGSTYTRENTLMGKKDHINGFINDVHVNTEILNKLSLITLIMYMICMCTCRYLELVMNYNGKKDNYSLTRGTSTNNAIRLPWMNQTK